MTINEMLETLREGKAVTCDDGRYMKIEDGRFVERSQESGRVVITSSRIFISIDNVLKNETDYRIYEKPILTDKEKEYLSAMIRPFSDRVKYIYKTNVIDGCSQFISIYMERYDYEENLRCEYMGLPRFKKETMYKGMETDKKYTLEELGL